MEIRSRSRHLCLASIVALLAPSGLSSQARQRLFIAESGGRWCSYQSEKELEAAPTDQDPEYVAIVESRGNRLSAIRVRRSTEDTTTFDEYLVSNDGDTLTRLKRSLDAISERITREQIWDLRSGTPAKLSESWMEFRTHKPIHPDDRLDDFVDHAVMTRVADLPFYLLIANPERWIKGNTCVAGDVQKLEAPMKR
jgi:hypothetical protein